MEVAPFQWTDPTNRQFMNLFQMPQIIKALDISTASTNLSELESPDKQAVLPEGGDVEMAIAIENESLDLSAIAVEQRKEHQLMGHKENMEMLAQYYSYAH